MYNIFYIYTYKYTRPSNTLTLSRSLNAHTIQERINSLMRLAHKRRPQAVYIGQKCTSRIMHQSIQLATCTYAAILKNCIMRSVFQFCLCL